MNLARLLPLPPGRVRTDPATLLVHECDALTLFRERPLAVVYPESTAEVAAAVRVLAAHGIPAVARGAGTGLSGGARPCATGVLMDLCKMDRILAIDAAHRTAHVQAGAVNARVSEAAAPNGLFFAPDPSSQMACTIGGNVACGSGGPHCLRYGTMTDHVRGLTLVDARGDVHEVADESLLSLLVGSEGTLGIVTEARLRLEPLPPAVATLLLAFPAMRGACDAVAAILEEGFVPAALEILDKRAVGMVEDSVFRAGYPRDAAAVLLVELDGTDAEVEEAAAWTQARWPARRARGAAERAALWRGRKGAFGAMGRVAEECYVVDCVVPRSRMADALEKIDAMAARRGLTLVHVFHAGDGNLHPLIAYRRADAARVQEAGREISEICLALGGSLTGEHGIGVEKRDFMPLLFDAASLAAMERVKKAFDPEGMLNPGKVLPGPKVCAEAIRRDDSFRVVEGGGLGGR
ncbi:MAG TPA: FAD-linked oxidase C-terminal domain-containing protein [Planctomycetota bacterium]|nr:FAD-linked oxidase C-terminal domain-containing protein [Planctomycetota bacterium]